LGEKISILHGFARLICTRCQWINNPEKDSFLCFRADLQFKSSACLAGKERGHQSQPISDILYWLGWPACSTVNEAGQKSCEEDLFFFHFDASYIFKTNIHLSYSFCSFRVCLGVRWLKITLCVTDSRYSQSHLLHPTALFWAHAPDLMASYWAPFAGWNPC
jgi:hypothetical protein